jgi:hypothetical protein
LVGPISKGLSGLGLLAHLRTFKYADHLPLNRVEGIGARNGGQAGNGRRATRRRSTS